MISEQEARRILDRVIEVARVKHVEGSLSGGNIALTRFAGGQIHQNVAERSLRLRVRALDGLRLGEARGSVGALEDVDGIVRSAEEIARFVAEDPDLEAPAGPYEYPVMGAYVKRTARATPDERAELVDRVVRRCRQADLRAAGILSTGAGGSGEYGFQRAFARANSSGQFAYHASSEASFSLTAEADDASGWCYRMSHDLADLDVDAETDRVVEKALLARRPRSVPAGRYTVVLEPNAVASLLTFLGVAFNALSVDEGRSFLAGGNEGSNGGWNGNPVFGEDLTLVDDFQHPLHQGRPWDGDGIPRRRVVLIEHGRPKGLVYDRKTARKHRVEPTGHGFGGTNMMGARPMHLVLEGGEGTGAGTAEDLVREVDDGILVTRLWYNNFVDERRQIITGMTRDGTFRIRKGRIAHGLKNLRFNVDWGHFARNILRKGVPVYASGTVAPALVAKDFHFTSTTRF